jgi:hypothetical protein
MPDVPPELGLVCEALAEWPPSYDAVELLSLNVQDVDPEAKRIQVVKRTRSDRWVPITGALGDVVLRAVELSKIQPLFATKRGLPWTYDYVRNVRRGSTGPTQGSELFLRAVACKRMTFKDLSGLLVSDAEKTVSKFAGGDFWTVLKEALQLALERPLFPTRYSDRWTRDYVSQEFHLHARRAGLPSNVQFPRPTRRGPRVSEDPLGTVSEGGNGQANEWTDYKTSKEWKRRWDASDRNWPRIKARFKHQPHPASRNMLRFVAEDLKRAGVDPS